MGKEEWDGFFRFGTRQKNRILALKTLRPDNLTPARRESFRNEFQILSELNHPNLETVYDYGLIRSGPEPLENSLFLTCEFLEGPHLTEAVDTGDWKSTLDLIVPILRGLQFLHSRGLVHYDVKPDNILVPETVDSSNSTSPESILIDFGLVREKQFPGTQSIRGTPGYIAPEII